MSGPWLRLRPASDGSKRLAVLSVNGALQPTVLVPHRGSLITVIDHLFVLNAKRAEEEKLKGLGGKPGKKKAGAKSTAKPEAGGKKRRKRPKEPEGQLVLLGGDDD
jgi:hypothetical protein